MKYILSCIENIENDKYKFCITEYKGVYEFKALKNGIEFTSYNCENIYDSIDFFVDTLQGIKLPF